MLIIHLKRFDNYQRKIKKFIYYDEILNLSKLNKNDSNEKVFYKLSSMLLHEGNSVDSGHYYSYIKASNNNWYIFNDHYVMKEDKNNILNQKPYLLFYEKIIEKKITQKMNYSNIKYESPGSTNYSNLSSFRENEKMDKIPNSFGNGLISKIFNKNNNEIKKFIDLENNKKFR